MAKGQFHKEAIEARNDCKQLYEKRYGFDKSVQLRTILRDLIIEYVINRSKEPEKRRIKAFLSLRVYLGFVEQVNIIYVKQTIGENIVKSTFVVRITVNFHCNTTCFSI